MYLYIFWTLKNSKVSLLLSLILNSKHIRVPAHPHTNIHTLSYTHVHTRTRTHTHTRTHKHTTDDMQLGMLSFNATGAASCSWFDNLFGGGGASHPPGVESLMHHQQVSKFHKATNTSVFMHYIFGGTRASLRASVRACVHAFVCASVRIRVQSSSIDHYVLCDLGSNHYVLCV